MRFFVYTDITDKAPAESMLSEKEALDLLSQLGHRGYAKPVVRYNGFLYARLKEVQESELQEDGNESIT